jgi:hypothetical protein
MKKLILFALCAIIFTSCTTTMTSQYKGSYGVEKSEMFCSAKEIPYIAQCIPSIKIRK